MKFSARPFVRHKRKATSNMYTHKIVLLARCQFTRACVATWLKFITLYFRSLRRVFNVVRTKSVSTSGLELWCVKLQIFFLQIWPLTAKKLGTWENPFVARKHRVSPTTTVVIFENTALLVFEQMGFKVVTKYDF